jgi:hypothetical protein
MFRAIVMPIFRSIRLEYSLWYVAPYVLPSVGLDADGLVNHTTGCILQSKAPEDGHNYCLKRVELTLEF